MGDLERLARRDFRAARRCGIEAPGVPAPQGRAPPGADHASRSRYPAVVQAVADILDDVSGVPVRGDRKVDEKARGQTLAATQPAAIRGGSLRRRRGGRRAPYYVRIGRRTAPCFQSEARVARRRRRTAAQLRRMRIAPSIRTNQCVLAQPRLHGEANAAGNSNGRIDDLLPWNFPNSSS